VRNPIDAFVLAKLEAKGIHPSPPADPLTLIRRVYYDLIGLPPMADEADTFVRECRDEALSLRPWALGSDPRSVKPAPGTKGLVPRPNAQPLTPGTPRQSTTPPVFEKAYGRLVDRLLGSPAYGERWGRYWLDLARYADTKGYVRLQEERNFPYAYTYRDYVIRSFNEDKPYDRFLLEQLAADQLPPGQGDLSALGFLTLGRRFTGNRHDIIDDRIDVVSRGLLGLTVACARCHDHKYDPIPTADYYSLYGVFAADEDPIYPAPLHPCDPKYTAFEQELERRKETTDRRETAAYAALLDEFRARTGDYLVKALEGREPPQQPLPHRPGEIRQLIVERWLDTLQDSSERADPVFGAWHAFAALDRARFREEAAAIVARWKSGNAGVPLNPRVREYFECRAPRSMADVARGYGELFEGVYQSVTTHRRAAEERARGVVNGSFEADGLTQNRPLRGWTLTGARLVTLNTEGRSDGAYAVVFADGTPQSMPPTAHAAELTQTVRTEPGCEYRLTFEYGAFGSPDPEHEQSLQVRVLGQRPLAERTVSARGSIPSVLRPQELTFVADGETAVLSFADVTANGETGRTDGVLDNVCLRMTRDRSGQPVPPPSPASTEALPELPAPDRELLDVLYGPASPVVVTRAEALDNYLYDSPVDTELYRLRNEVGAWLAKTGEAPPRAHTLVPRPGAGDPRILVRGNPQRPGGRVPRQFLALLSGPARRPFQAGAARLDLAREIVRPDNPLTARVLVNRVWQHHFGAGLVRTPSDFGLRGESPTHPELLDWLASAFVGTGATRRGRVGEGENGGKGEVSGRGASHSPAHPLSHSSSNEAGDTGYPMGWSLKRLHRLIVTSSTYRQASTATPSERTHSPTHRPSKRLSPQDWGGRGAAHTPALPHSRASSTEDPDNRLVGRMNRRRLDLEAFRDSLLQAAGRLDPALGGPSVDVLQPGSCRRTVYAMVDRQNLPGMLRLFDFANPDVHAAQRYVTTVPLQALFLLNSPFMEEVSRALAERSAALPPAERLRRLYRDALARDPRPEETQRGLRFLEGGGSWPELAQALLLSNEFAFVD
jgi:hypothetical protein